jgi:excisionase family DNA binding protein
MQAVQQVLWTIAEVVEQWKFSRSTLYRLMESGELPYVQVNRRRLIPTESLIALCEARLVDRDGLLAEGLRLNQPAPADQLASRGRGGVR